jgi:uncharacterized protein with beta-barrel porin domain
VLTCGATRQLLGSPGGSSTAIGATVGYNATAGGWDLNPSLSLNSRNVSINGFSETEQGAPSTGGGLALTYKKQKVDSLRSIIAFNLSKSISRSFGVVTPTFDLEWHHEYQDKARVVSANYTLDTNGIAPFSMPTDKADSDFGIVRASLAASFARRLQGYVSVQGVLANQIKSNSVAFGLRGQF